MCWSADGSLKTYLFGMVLAAIHKQKGDLDPSLWLLMVVFTHMQLVEYFLWKNLPTPAANRFWSGAGVALLFAQPLISAMLLKTSTRNKLWIAYIISALYYFATRKVDLSTDIGGNGHLKWNWIPSFTSPWTIGWLVMLVGPMIMTGHNMSAVFGIVTYMASLYFNDKYGTAGSYWCWFAISTWLLAFIKY